MKTLDYASIFHVLNFDECLYIAISAVTEYYEKRKRLLNAGLLGLDDVKDDIEVADGAQDTVDEKPHDKESPKKCSLLAAIRMLGYASQVRQRQAISHVYCIKRLLRHSFSIKQLRGLGCALKGIGNKQTILEQIQLGATESNGILRYKTGLQILQERKENFFSKYLDMGPLLNILGLETSLRDVTCLLYKKAKPPVDPVFSANISQNARNKCTNRTLTLK